MPQPAWASGGGVSQVQFVATAHLRRSTTSRILAGQLGPGLDDRDAPGELLPLMLDRDAGLVCGVALVTTLRGARPHRRGVGLAG
jgi:hypothetical protein